MVWEAHKSYIRVILIKIGSRLKKARTQQTVDLLEKIWSLEAIRKKSLAVLVLADLTNLRRQVRSLALVRAKVMIAKCKCTFYEHSNKYGKLLARALRAQPQTFIPKLLSDGKTKVHATEEIADLFHKYYTSLYNLLCPSSGREKSAERKAIREYLQKSGLPRLSRGILTALEALEDPLSSDPGDSPNANRQGPWPGWVLLLV